MRAFSKYWVICLYLVPQPTHAQSGAGQALSLDGNGDYVVVNHNNSLQPNRGNFTFECWIKRRDLDTTRIMGVIGKGADLDVIEWQVQIHPNGRWQFDYGNRIYPISSNILDTLWHHLAATVDRIGDNLTIRAYLDGQQDGVATGSHSYSITNQDPLYLGADRRHDTFFNGLIDEIRLWNIAKSQAEIQSLKNLTLSGSEIGLVAYWKFDGNANDSSPFGNNGVLQGNACFVTSDAPINTRAEYVRDSNTVGLWHMNELSGSTVKDVSSNSNTGSAIGATIVDGRFGKARRFSGAGQYIDLPESSSLTSLPDKLTIDAWTYLYSYPAAGEGNHIVSSGNQNDYDLSVQGDRRLGAHLYLSTGPAGMFGKNVVPLNRWVHVAMTYDGSNVRFYINGVLDTTFVRTGTIGGSPQAENIAIGAYLYNGSFTQFFNGIIDEVRISKVARAPEDFNLQLPPTGLTATGSGTTINVTWQNGGGSVALLRYKIYRGTDSATVEILDSTSSTSYLNSNLSPGTKYFYRVSAVDSTGFEGAKSYSAAAITAPPAPTLLSPINGVTGQPTTVTLSWNPASGSTLYRVQVSKNASFAPVFFEDSTLANTARQVENLDSGATYYWRVNARNMGGTSGYSAVRSFTTVVQPPRQVSLVYPANSQLVGATVVPFIWRQTYPAVNRYWFEISTDSLFVFRAVDSVITDTAYIVQNLKDSESYWWKVSAHNVAGWGPFSETRAFRIVLTSAPEESQSLPQVFSLMQNYPNPFNPSTVITYGLPHTVMVTLGVHNTLGQEVALLVNRQQEAGYHRVVFQNSALSSGVYFYRLKAGDFGATRRFLLLK